MVLNTRVKPALSRKQVSITPVSNTGIKPHTGDPQFHTSLTPVLPHKTPLGKPTNVLNVDQAAFTTTTQICTPNKSDSDHCTTSAKHLSISCHHKK